MSTQLRVRFDHTDRAEIALRLLRDNGIEPESFTLRPSGGTEERLTEYGALMPAMLADLPFGSGGGVGAGGFTGDGMTAPFIPLTLGLYEYTPGGTVDMAGGEVELLLTVPEAQGRRVRTLLRSAHGRQIH